MSQSTADGQPVTPESLQNPAPAGHVASSYPTTSTGALAQSSPAAGGPVGKIRGTGLSILLAVITFGVYSLVWYFKTHEEMKRHSGDGLGGGLALVLALFVGIASPFLSSSEVGKLYDRAGMPQPVSGKTGLWYMPGIFILVGPVVWFVKTNGALNAYWRSQGAHA